MLSPEGKLRTQNWAKPVTQNFFPLPPSLELCFLNCTFPLVKYNIFTLCPDYPTASHGVSITESHFS